MYITITKQYGDTLIRYFLLLTLLMQNDTKILFVYKNNDRMKITFEACAFLVMIYNWLDMKYITECTNY